MASPLERIADFDLSEEQRLVRATVREFAEKELLPHVERYEREERYPLELIAKLPALGLMGPMIPERYGGSKIDVVTYGIICEELARGDWVVASVVSVSNSLVAGSILRWGTEAQKERWLPQIASGDCICSACLTEPGGGTDLGNMKSTAPAGRRSTTRCSASTSCASPRCSSRAPSRSTARGASPRSCARAGRSRAPPTRCPDACTTGAPARSRAGRVRSRS